MSDKAAFKYCPYCGEVMPSKGTPCKEKKNFEEITLYGVMDTYVGKLDRFPSGEALTPSKEKALSGLSDMRTSEEDSHSRDVVIKFDCISRIREEGNK